jgi:hypothetical protein
LHRVAETEADPGEPIAMSEPALSREQIRRGRPEPAPPRREVRAGPIAAILDGPDLRHVRVGGAELAQRIYMAVRDLGWNTIPGTFTDERADIRADSFDVEFTGRHRYGDIDYEWRATISGSPDGTVSYAMDGRALTAFQYNKIGFNVHHALSESVGRRYRARTPVGEISGVFPSEIDPQRVEDGRLTGMFPPYDWLAVELPSGLEARFTFEGDQFEMQDHRNWTDANFKSYGTPLSVPFPMDAAAGQTFHQKVTISFSGPLELAPPAPGPPTITIRDPLGRRFPPIGFGMPSHGKLLSDAEAELMRAVRPAHLRTDLHPADPGVAGELERAMGDAARLDAPLEVALFLTQDTEAELARCASLFETARPPVARVLVFAEGGFAAGLGSTPAELVTRTRAVLGPVLPGVPFGGGSNVFFADINRDRPAAGEWDLVAYPICPTVHAADDASIVENLAAQAETLSMTRSLVGDTAIAIGPVTLATRFGPYPGGPPEPDGLPGPVDPRQLSLLGGAWALGSAKYLAEGGAASATYFETTGWRGLVETDAGSPMPGEFPAGARAAFPMYHVFADLADWREGDLVDATSSDPLAAEALVLRRGERLLVLLANVSPDAQHVTVQGAGERAGTIRVLDEESASGAMTDPAAFRSSAPPIEASGGRLELDLRPYAVARIELG